MYSRRYKPGDLDKIAVRSGEKNSEYNFDKEAENGIAYTFVDSEGTICGVMGMNVLWVGVAQVWAVMSDDLRGHGFQAVRVCRALLDNFMDSMELKRVHALVDGGSKEYLQFVRLLGFEYEFTMYGAAPSGNDFIGVVKWARVQANQNQITEECGPTIKAG